MKKFFLILILFFVSIGNVFANYREEVTLSKCVDGDTAKFILNDDEITARFLAIDTPESVHPKKEVEPYGKEASNYTCNKLKEADKIEIEYDDESNKTDKYNRYLVWVFIDDKLLQEDLVENGYAKVAYLYGDYKYTDLLKACELDAKNNKLKIWNETISVETKENNYTENSDESTLNICLYILIIIVLYFLYKKKIITKSQYNKLKKKVTK